MAMRELDKVRCPLPAAGRIKTGRDVFTTGQIAQICGVASRTVAKWFDAGRLTGYRILGDGDRGGDRRVTREELTRFARREGIPIGIDERRSVSCLGADESESVTIFALGPLVDRAKVVAVSIGCADGLLAAVALAREVRAADPTIRLTLLLPEDRPASDVPGGVFDEIK